MNEKRSKGLYVLKNIAACLFIIFGLVSAIVTVNNSELGLMGGTSVGSIYYDESSNELFYSGKDGNIYSYNADTSEINLVIKNADEYFGVENNIIYYTSNDKYYKYTITTEQSEKIEDFSDSINLLYSDSVENSSEINTLLQNNEEVAEDSPYAVYGENQIFIVHNMSGGYISVYTIEGDNIDIDSEIVLEHSYTMWQSIMSSIGTINLGTLALKLLFLFIIPISLIIVGVIMLTRKRY